jgi:hypothetical protein
MVQTRRIHANLVSLVLEGIGDDKIVNASSGSLPAERTRLSVIKAVAEKTALATSSRQKSDRGRAKLRSKSTIHWNGIY